MQVVFKAKDMERKAHYTRIIKTHVGNTKKFRLSPEDWEDFEVFQPESHTGLSIEGCRTGRQTGRPLRRQGSNPYAR